MCCPYKEYMLLAIDIGNTSIHNGIFDKRSLNKAFRVPAYSTKLDRQYKRALKTYFNKIDSVIVTSVVPGVLKKVERIIKKFINKLNFRGKKSLAEKIIYQAMDVLKEKTKENPVKVVTQAVDKVRPLLEVKPRRVGGATFQVPVEVKPDRSYSLALRWIINYARQRKGKPMSQKLAEELLDAYQGQGAATKKREDTHKMAEANRAFAHYRW
ncbi:MAG TPA: 30S ribosomal protein S7 [Elusimicrobia bacterium]|nr:30S ribosomal protein S7 [Elusimicrobiota bacterium]